MDVWGRRGAVGFPAPARPDPNPAVDEEAAERAAKILGAAKRPLIIVGGGALNASKEVLELAEARSGTEARPRAESSTSSAAPSACVARQPKFCTKNVGEVAT